MGIETDWNCAISLRHLEDSSQPDPHRMKSNYADWDVKVSEVLAAIDLFDGGNAELLLFPWWVSDRRDTTTSQHTPCSLCWPSFWVTFVDMILSNHTIQRAIPQKPTLVRRWGCLAHGTAPESAKV